MEYHIKGEYFDISEGINEQRHWFILQSEIRLKVAKAGD